MIMKKIIKSLIVISFLAFLTTHVGAKEYFSVGLYQEGNKKIAILAKGVSEKNNIVIEATDFTYHGDVSQLSSKQIIKLANAKAYNKKTKEAYAIKVNAYTNCVQECNEVSNDYLFTVKDNGITITTYSHIPDETTKQVVTSAQAITSADINAINNNGVMKESEKNTTDKIVPIAIKDVQWMSQSSEYYLAKNDFNYIVLFAVVALGSAPVIYMYHEYRRSNLAIKRIVGSYFSHN